VQGSLYLSYESTSDWVKDILTASLQANQQLLKSTAHKQEVLNQMSMRDFGRKRPELPPASAPTNDPNVVRFLEHLSQQESDLKLLRHQLGQAQADIAVLTQQKEWLEKQFDRQRLELAAYRRGFESLWAQISVVANAASTALEQARNGMLQVNIDVQQVTHQPDPQEDAKLAELGAKYGADNREDNHE
jgi:capsule polysaccharide export protein KpsE/RkpR